MGSLYELTGEFLQFSDVALQSELTEEQQTMLAEALENLKEDIEFKLEGYCKVIKNFEADIAGLKAEEERLANRRKTLENRIKTMKEAMKSAILAVKPDEPKIKTALFSFAVQNNAPSVVIDEQYIENIPTEYLKFAEPEINKKKLGEDLKAGVAPEGIAHLETSSSLRIR